MTKFIFFLSIFLLLMAASCIQNEKNVLSPTMVAYKTKTNENPPTPSPTMTKAPAKDGSTVISEIEVIHDKTYAIGLQPGVSNQELDIYAPKINNIKPVIILLHGFRANKESHQSASKQLAEQGAIVYTINWPSMRATEAVEGNGRGYREMYEVLSCAVKFARENSTIYGGNQDNVILIGFSSGAGTGSWFSLSGGQLDMLWDDFHETNDGPPTQIGCISDESLNHVNTFIGIGGQYQPIGFLLETNQNLWDIINIENQIGNHKELTVRLLHGENDVDVSLDEPSYLNTILFETGYDVELIMYDGSHWLPIGDLIQVVNSLWNR